MSNQNDDNVSKADKTAGSAATAVGLVGGCASHGSTAAGIGAAAGAILGVAAAWISKLGCN